MRIEIAMLYLLQKNCPSTRVEGQLTQTQNKTRLT